MPIYEFACPKCRRIYNFLSKRINPSHTPACPKCGNRNLSRQMSRFAALKGLADEPRVERAMAEMERDMAHLDEHNPRHMAHMLKKMKDIMPAGSLPKEMDVAIRRLEAGEDPDKVEEDMGDILGDLMGGEGGPGGGGGYTQDGGLYDY